MELVKEHAIVKNTCMSLPSPLTRLWLRASIAALVSGWTCLRVDMVVSIVLPTFSCQGCKLASPPQRCRPVPSFSQSLANSGDPPAVIAE